MPEGRLTRPPYPLASVPAWCGMAPLEHLSLGGCWSLSVGWVDARGDCEGCRYLKEEKMERKTTSPEQEALWADVGQVLNGLAKVIHQDMVERGFYGDDLVKRNTPEVLAIAHCGLIGTEVSEMIEEVRSGRPMTEVRTRPDGKPEGFPMELADVLIRCFDTAAYHGIDLGEAVRLKTMYNRSRPHKHGKVA